MITQDRCPCKRLPAFIFFFSLSLSDCLAGMRTVGQTAVPAINKDLMTFASAQSLSSYSIIQHFGRFGFLCSDWKSIACYYRFMSSFPRRLVEFPALPGVSSTQPEMTGRSLHARLEGPSPRHTILGQHAKLHKKRATTSTTKINA